MFASDLDKATQSMLARGQRLVEILKQKQYSPLPVEKQIAILFAATNGYLDAFPVAEARRYEEELYTFLETRHPAGAEGHRGEEGPERRAHRQGQGGAAGVRHRFPARHGRDGVEGHLRHMPAIVDIRRRIRSRSRTRSRSPRP